MKPAYIDTTANVHETAKIGENSFVWNWTKVRENAKIGSNCNIGQCVYIDFDVEIGTGCKVQNGVSVYNGVTISDNVFVGPNVTFTNDMVPRANNTEWKVTPTMVQEGSSIGANATIICGVTIGRYSLVGAGAVVTKDVPEHALVVGQPAKIIDYVKRDGSRLHWDLNNGVPNQDLLE